MVVNINNNMELLYNLSICSCVFDIDSELLLAYIFPQGFFDAWVYFGVRYDKDNDNNPKKTLFPIITSKKFVKRLLVRLRYLRRIFKGSLLFLWLILVICLIILKVVVLIEKK